MLGRMLLTVQFAQQTDALVDSASDSTKDKKVASRGLILQHLVDSFAEVGAVLVRVF